MHASPDFLYFFRRSETDLRAFIGAMVRDSHAREDLFQEVSQTLWQKFDSYDLSRPFGAWARGIAAKKMLEARRKSARFPLLFPPEVIAAVAEAFDDTDGVPGEQQAALRLCLEALPPHSRKILTLRYEERLSCEGIARSTGGTMAGVHQTLSRLRRGLRRCISKRLAEEDFRPVPAIPEP